MESVCGAQVRSLAECVLCSRCPAEHEGELTGDPQREAGCVKCWACSQGEGEQSAQRPSELEKDKGNKKDRLPERREGRQAQTL